MKNALISRNEKIIEIVKNKINRECPNSIDLFGIGGSVCSGDFYEKSDLDLVLISKDNDAKCLDECFILKDVAFDIYTHDWTSFEKMARYENPFVTKLIDLKIIETSKSGEKYYAELQNKLRKNLNNDAMIEQNMRKHCLNMVRELKKMKLTTEKGNIYSSLARIIRCAEYVVYMTNKAYVKRGTKRIPTEIENMSKIPAGFLDVYDEIVSLSDTEKVKEESEKLVNIIKVFLDYEPKSAESVERKNRKRKLEPKDLVGSYEELWSNYKNKMIHAAEIHNLYLSFVTMAGAQEFYDDFYCEFEIPRIDLVSYYNPNDLFGNAKNFDASMEKWKKYYDRFGVRVEYYDNLEEFEKTYTGGQA